MPGQKKVLSIALLVACTAIGAISWAQQKTVNDGVFTESQVVAGKAVYESNCQVCHAMRDYRDILRKWDNQSLLDFWYSVLAEMPMDNPGSLLDSEYTEVIAYILSEHGFPAGDTALDSKNGMDQINVLAP